MQKENSFFFSFPSLSIFGKAKDTKKFGICDVFLKKSLQECPFRQGEHYYSAKGDGKWGHFLFFYSKYLDCSKFLPIFAIFPH